MGEQGADDLEDLSKGTNRDNTLAVDHSRCA